MEVSVKTSNFVCDRQWPERGGNHQDGDAAVRSRGARAASVTSGRVFVRFHHPADSRPDLYRLEKLEETGKTRSRCEGRALDGPVRKTQADSPDGPQTRATDSFLSIPSS